MPNPRESNSPETWPVIGWTFEIQNSRIPRKDLSLPSLGGIRESGQDFLAILTKIGIPHPPDKDLPTPEGARATAALCRIYMHVYTHLSTLPELMDFYHFFEGHLSGIQQVQTWSGQSIQELSIRS